MIATKNLYTEQNWPPKPYVLSRTVAATAAGMPISAAGAPVSSIYPLLLEPRDDEDEGRQDSVYSAFSANSRRAARSRGELTRVFSAMAPVLSSVLVSQWLSEVGGGEAM